MSSVVETVRQVCRQFCLEFVENPYLCYTEHGLHALFFARLYQALPEHARYTCWEGQRVCVTQKEYPTAHALIKPRRQHWDIAVIKTPPESSAEIKQPSYDFLRLAAVVEFGMNETEGHLRDDLARLCHERANVDQGFIIHLYRLSEGHSRFSGRDWSARSSQILKAEEVAKVAQEVIPAGKNVEIFYGLHDTTDTHPSGAWLIVDDEPQPLHLMSGEQETQIGPFARHRIALFAPDASPDSQRSHPLDAAHFFPGGKWVGAVRNTAEQVGIDFFVLTTGHGLVAGDEVLTGYDLHVEEHQAEVIENWRRTIPRLISAGRYDVVVFYTGGCPERYVELLQPVLHEECVPLLSFGKPSMFDSGNIKALVELLMEGTSLDELRSLLNVPEKLQYFPA